MARERTVDPKVVKRLQQRLTEGGYGQLRRRRDYGPATREAVMRLLSQDGPTDSDGELTPEVVERLERLLDAGPAPPEVKRAARPVKSATQRARPSRLRRARPQPRTSPTTFGSCSRCSTSRSTRTRCRRTCCV